MASWLTRGDALRLVYQPGVFDILTGFLKCVGTIPGVAPIAAAGICGEGLAAIASHDDGTALCFRAPGSQTFGPTVAAGVDGDYLLEDGEDKNKWLRVKARAAFLSPTPQEARVFLRIEDSEMVPGATIGGAVNLNLQLQNVSSKKVENVRVWSPTSGVTFNVFGAGDIVAASEATSFLIGAMLAGGVQDLGMILTVPGGTSPNPAAPAELRAKWDSL